MVAKQTRTEMSTPKPATKPLVDIQSSHDGRNIPIDKVGVRNVKYPIKVLEREGGVQHTSGVFSLTVDLPRHFKGTHMSRFLEVLGEYNHEIGGDTIPRILAKLRDRLDAEDGASGSQIQLVPRKGGACFAQGWDDGVRVRVYRIRGVR